MKKIFLPVIAIATIVILGAFIPGKEKAFEGKIVYEIVYEEVPEMLEPYIALLPKESISYVKGDAVRTETGTMGISTIMVFDSKKKEGFMIMEGMGMEKTAYTMSPEDFKKAEETDQKPTVIKTTETKTINGYECTKELFIMPAAPEDTLEAYVTTKITGKNQQMTFLSGFPLQYQVRANGMATTVTVKEMVKQKVNDAFFKIPEGVPVKPYSELVKMGQIEEDVEENEEGDE